MQTLDPALLRCFVAVVDHGNFTAAGEHIGLTQSAVSLRIKRLEQVLGRRLFERTSRSMSLSVHGQQLLADARQILDLNESIFRRFREPETAGSLRVGFADYVISRALQTVLARFTQFYPRVALEVVTGLGLDLTPRFESGNLALMVAGTEHTQNDVLPLYSEPLHWCGADRFAQTDESTVPLISLPDPCSHRAAGIKQLLRVGRKWTQIFTGTSVSGIREAACAGLGVAVLPASAFDKRCNRLTETDGFPTLPTIQIGAYIRPDADEPAHAFLSFFKDECPWTTPDSSDQLNALSNP